MEQTITFYNLKTRQKEEVPYSKCTRVVYGEGTPKVRYGLKGESASGSPMAKFVNKATYDSLTAIKEA
jgi:hypothetical protein